jgi:hypothetical protein
VGHPPAGAVTTAVSVAGELVEVFTVRLERLVQRVGGLPPPGQLDLVVAVPVGSGIAADLPPGVHFNVDGRVATVVFDGAEPDPEVLVGLEARLVVWGNVIQTHTNPLIS